MSAPQVLSLPGGEPDLAAALAEGWPRSMRCCVRRSTTTTRSSRSLGSPARRRREAVPADADAPGGQLGRGVTDEVIAAAVGVELTHLASLYHDDVMDEADGAPWGPERQRGIRQHHGDPRRRPAVREGVGDRRRARPEAVRIQAQTFVRLCARADPRRPAVPADADPIDYYLGVLADKTGALIATAARYGAMFGGGEAGDGVEVMRVIRRAARGWRSSWPTTSSTSPRTGRPSGKTPGTDLREGRRHPRRALHARSGAPRSDAMSRARTCSACALLSCGRPVSPDGRRTWNGWTFRVWLVSGTTVTTPRPRVRTAPLRPSLLTITTGRRSLASDPRCGSRSAYRISPRLTR
jgi:heptaprenyl diphosphate synthase